MSKGYKYDDMTKAEEKVEEKAVAAEEKGFTGEEKKGFTMVEKPPTVLEDPMPKAKAPTVVTPVTTVEPKKAAPAMSHQVVASPNGQAAMHSKSRKVRKYY